MATGGFLPAGGRHRQKLIKDGDIPGVAKFVDDLAIQNEDDMTLPQRDLLQFTGTGVRVGDDEAEGKTVVTVTAGTLRQLDLAIPGKFATETTNLALLLRGKDHATWQLEPCALKKIMARAYAADSGAIPASVYLVINGTQVGDAVPVYASSWSEIVVSGTIDTGDTIEIGVSASGTSGDSENLRFTVVAEVMS